MGVGGVLAKTGGKGVGGVGGEGAFRRACAQQLGRVLPVAVQVMGGLRAPRSGPAAPGVDR